jgi:mycothiol synthase
MSDPAYIIRNYRFEDFDRLVQLASQVEKIEQSCCGTSSQDVVEGLGRPNHFPEDNLFVAERAGSIVGYLDVMPELNIGRAIFSCLVHPEHRRRGFAKRLVERALHRAGELRVRIAHVNLPQDKAMAKRLFFGMGFRFVRRFLELRLDLSKARLPKIDQVAFPCRCLRAGEEGKLMAIQNRSFANTWGYSPNSIEDIMYLTSLPNRSLEDIVLAWDADRPVGYCWTKIEHGEEKAVGGGKGRIYMLGVDPDYRGKQGGRQVLVAGLSHLKSKGVGIVELTVDHENKVACGLYRSAGFEVWSSSLWYEKVLG